MSVLRRVGGWLDDRVGIRKALAPILEHRVPRRSRWAYVFGSATLFAFLLQVATGVALANSYVPSAGQAWDSLRFITYDAPLGSVIRGLHYFGASAMIVLVGAHTIRVFLTGSYKFPREVSWLSGVILLLLTVLMGFSGQLLRWEQTAVWSVIVGAEQAGRAPVIGPWLARGLRAGATVGGSTLSRFFALHVFIVPALIIGLVAFHLDLVLHTGISEPPVAGRPVDPATNRRDYEELLAKDGVPFWPSAAWRDAVFGLVVIAAVLALAIAFGPPDVGKPPDPSIVEASPRPDWYLLWYFAILAMLPHGTEAWFIILAPLAIGVVLIAVPFVSSRGERHPARRPWAVLAVVAICAGVATLWRAGVTADWSPAFEAKPLTAAAVAAPRDTLAARGATLFHERGCEYCHTIAGQGGRRGPDLSQVGLRLTDDQLVLRILNGAPNMPSFAASLSPEEVSALVKFLHARR